ncbi:MAG: hypothetical protein EPO08_10815 [Rhodospirillaceae bacterium]|nr:MAG: hypothetical protein EPO08_10815 [Rhodospirillaceae bacterium]
MTAAAPDPRLRRLARSDALGRVPIPGLSSEPSSDRIFVTLLSLNFMLLAFFVVLGTAASVDRTRARSVAENVRIAFSGAMDSEKARTTRLSARQALQAGVSEALAAILPSVHRYYLDNSDRVDVDVPVEPFLDADSEGSRDGIYDNVAHLLQAAPPGYRYALLISGGAQAATDDAAAFRFAGALADRGVAPQNLLVGSGGSEDRRLHLSFLLFEGETDEVEPWSAGMLESRPGLDPAGQQP